MISSVWQVGNFRRMISLHVEKIQRKGLALLLGVLGTACAESAEVETGILPLELRRQELSI